MTKDRQIVLMLLKRHRGARSNHKLAQESTHDVWLNITSNRLAETHNAYVLGRRILDE